LDTRTGLANIQPVPWVDAEMLPWARPSAAASFPVHPLGVIALYDRAMFAAAKEAAELFDGPDDERHAALDAEVWRISLLLFSAGAPIRAAIDRLLERKAYLPRKTPASDEATAARSVSLLACHFVIVAACEMTGARS
jgi:hypothetical protein